MFNSFFNLLKNPTSQIPSGNQRPPVQLILYHSIHVLIIIGSIIAVVWFPDNVAVAWLFSLGLLNCVLIRLPPNWFGDRSDKTQVP